MADNVEVDSGTGIPVATDEIGGYHYQRVKATFGVDGTATDVSSSDPMPVVDASLAAYVDGLEALITTLNGYIDGLESLIGTTNINTASLVTLITTLNGYVDGLEAALAGTLNITGTVDLGPTDNAVLDSIQTAIEAVQAAIEGTLTVSGTVDLGAVDNAVLDAIQTATEATQSALAGTISVDTGLDQPLTDAELRDSPVPVDTGLTTQTDALTDAELRANPVPVSATDFDIRNLTNTDVVTAELSATDNAVLDDILAKLDDIETALNGINPPNMDKHVSDIGQLVSNTVKTVDLDADGDFTPVELEIVNSDGAAAIYITLDGTDPDTASDNAITVLPATPSVITFPCTNDTPQIKMKSTGTPQYTVVLRGY